MNVLKSVSAFLMVIAAFVSANAADKTVYEKDIETLEAQLFPEGSQPLAFTKIAMPLEGFLIQAIPQRNAAMFDKDDVIKSTAASGREFYYVINPGVRELIDYLQKNKYDLKVYTQLEDKVAQTLLALVDKDLDPKSLMKLDDSKTLTAANVGKDFLYVTYNDVKAPVATTLPTGPLLYVFPSFEKMKENKVDSPPHKAFFTDDEKVWAVERYKAPRVMAYLYEANRIDERNFATIKKAMEKESQVAIYSRGRKYARGDYSRLSYKWKIDAKAKAVTGCEIVDSKKNESIKDADLAACEEELQVFAKFANDGKNPRVLSCELRTLDGKKMVRAGRDLQDCMANASGLRYATEFDSKQCAAFTKDGLFIAFGGKEQCDQQFVILVPKKGKYYFFKPFKGLEKLSRAELIATVITPPPTASNPYRLWDSLEDNWHGGMALSECVDGRQTMKEDANGLLPKCQPDTLYSWGDQAKIDALMQVMGRRAKWTNMRAVFNSRGPIATFGYGDVPIRIKLKKGVQFKRGSHMCDKVSQAEADNTVYYRKDNAWSDWLVCSANVIHSWSHDTKEHYDEMVKDYWRNQEAVASGKSLLGIVEFYGIPEQLSTIFFGGAIDGRGYYTEGHFKTKMINLINRIENDKEDVIFNPALPESEKKWDKHFETAKPVYWNDK